MTDTSAPLPDVELPPGCTVTIDTGDPNAIITVLNVYGASDTLPTVEPTLPLLLPTQFTAV